MMIDRIWDRKKVPTGNHDVSGGGIMSPLLDQMREEVVRVAKTHHPDWVRRKDAPDHDHVSKFAAAGRTPVDLSPTARSVMRVVRDGSGQRFGKRGVAACDDIQVVL